MARGRLSPVYIEYGGGARWYAQSSVTELRRLRCTRSVQQTVKGYSGRFLELPKQIAFSDYPPFSHHGVLFIFSKFNTAIEKTGNEDDAEVSFQIYARSTVVWRHKWYRLSGRAGSRVWRVFFV